MPTMQPMMPSMSMGAPLPPGWQLAMDQLGRPFYYNFYTQQTSWTPPTSPSIPTAASMYSAPAPPAAVAVPPPVSAPIIPSTPPESPTSMC